MTLYIFSLVVSFPVSIDIFFRLFSLSYLLLIKFATFIEKANGSAGLDLPYLILEMCDGSNTMFFDSSLMFILSVIISSLKFLLNIS